MKLLLLGISLGLSLLVYAQDLQELERRKGFKDIKLESNVNEVQGAEFKKDIREKKEFPVKLYSLVNKDYERIGEIRIKSIELKVYKDKIYEIIVVTDKDPRLMKSLEEAFGPPAYNARSDAYSWLAETVSLAFSSKSKKELEMIYRSSVVVKQMSADKKEDIKKMSSDF